MSPWGFSMGGRYVSAAITFAICASPSQVTISRFCFYDEWESRNRTSLVRGLQDDGARSRRGYGLGGSCLLNIMYKTMSQVLRMPAMSSRMQAHAMGSST